MRRTAPIRRYDGPGPVAVPRFLQISGSRIVYDAGAPAGYRLYELHFSDGVTREADTELLAALLIAVSHFLWRRYHGAEDF